MRAHTKFILAGVAVGGLAAAGAMAAENSHVLTVRLPDGSQEQIRYTGDVAPKVRILSGPQAFVAFAPAFDPFGPGSPFAAMQRIEAAMDRDAARLMSQGEALTPQGGGFKTVNLGSLPPGVSGYRVVSTFSGGKMCTHTTSYSGGAAGHPAKIETSSSGDCGPARTGAPLMTAAPARPAPSERASALTRTGYSSPAQRVAAAD